MAYSVHEYSMICHSWPVGGTSCIRLLQWSCCISSLWSTMIVLIVIDMDTIGRFPSPPQAPLCSYHQVSEKGYMTFSYHLPMYLSYFPPINNEQHICPLQLCGDDDPSLPLDAVLFLSIAPTVTIQCAPDAAGALLQFHATELCDQDESILSNLPQYNTLNISLHPAAQKTQLGRLYQCWCS